MRPRLSVLLVLLPLVIGCSADLAGPPPARVDWDWSRRPVWSSGKVWASGEQVWVGGLSGIHRWEAGRWRWEPFPFRTDGSVRDLFGFGPDDVFAVLSDGKIVHFDGGEWREMAVPVTRGVSTLWGPSREHLFAVGSRGQILRFDGARWAREESSTDATLYAVHGLADGTTFALGWDGTMVRRNADGWAPVPGPEGDFWRDLWVSSADDIHVVGGWSDQGKIARFDGSGWTIVEEPPSDLSAIEGNADGSLLVGGSTESLRWDGTAWTAVSFPAGASDLAAVGNTWIWLGRGGLVFRGDGGRWEDMLLKTGRLLDICNAGEAWFAVGRDGAILRYQDDVWVSLPDGPDADLEQVWGASADDLHVVTMDGRVLHYDGTAWTEQLPGDTRYRRIHGRSASDVVAVGRGEASVVRFDGTDWSPMPDPSKGQILSDVWVDPDGMVWLASTGGVHRHDGVGWTTWDLGQMEEVRGLGVDDVYAMTPSNNLMHFDGTGWSPVDSGGQDQRFWALAAAGEHLMVLTDGFDWRASRWKSRVSWRSEDGWTNHNMDTQANAVAVDADGRAFAIAGEDGILEFTPGP